MPDSDNVVVFPGVTLRDLTPDQVLDGAKGKLDMCIVIGWAADNELYVAMSSGELPINLWLLELAKKSLLEAEIVARREEDA